MSDYQRVRGSKKYDIFPLDSLHVGIISGKPRIIDNYLISKSEWWLQHVSACLTPKRHIFQMGIVPKKGARWTNLQPILEHIRNMLKANKQCYRLVLYQAPTHAASIHFSEEPAVLPLSADWSWSISLNSRSWFPAGYQCRNGWVIILPWYAPKFAILRGKQLLDLDSYHVHSFSTNGKSQPLEKGPITPFWVELSRTPKDGSPVWSIVARSGPWPTCGKEKASLRKLWCQVLKMGRKYRWNQMKSRGDKFGWRYPDSA